MFRTRESRYFILVLVAASLIALASARPFAGSWNDGSRLATVESLVDRGALCIDESPFVAVPAEGSPYEGVALENGTLDKLWIDGHFYSDKSPVPALLLALVYQLLQSLFGLDVRHQPGLFCYLMTLASSGLAYVVAVGCVYRLGRPLRLPLGSRLWLTASFALATVALVYSRHVNNHLLLLGVAAALLLQLAHLAVEAPAQRVPWPRWLLVGALAGLGYTIDLGAGPGLLVCCGLLVLWRGRSITALALFALAALPWLALHHLVNYAVGGTFGPANAVAEYLQWDGSPFHGNTLTGSWHHAGLLDFAVYALALLFGKHGFIGHNLPLFLAMCAPLLLLRLRPREGPELLGALLWCVGTWLVYAASSRNYSGANCSVRWFVPLLAPAYFALAVLLRDAPRYRGALVLLSAWGTLLMGIAWCYGPWIAHMVPGLWPIQAAALASWAMLAWRGRKQNTETLDVDAGVSMRRASWLHPAGRLARRTQMHRFLMVLIALALVPHGGAAQLDKTYKIGGNYQVETIKDIAYYTGDGADPVRHKLDLYLPKGQKDFPVLIFVHGGAWKSGSKDMYGAIGKVFAQNGVGTVIINYRLSPKVKHPAHIEDVARAFAWTHKNIAKYGGDPKDIFVSGHSAGGHLVSLLSTNETYLKAQGLATSDIKGTLPISGVFIIVPNLMFKDIFTADKEVVKSASPIEHVKGPHPPCLMLYADKDFLALDSMAEQMCKKLKECNCEASTLKINDRTHISIITGLVNTEDPANQAILEFIAKHGGLKLKEVKK